MGAQSGAVTKAGVLVMPRASRPLPRESSSTSWASRSPLRPGSKLEVRRIPNFDEAFAEYGDNKFITKAAGSESA